MEKRLTVGCGSIALGSAAMAGGQWLSVLLLARSGTTDQVGLYGLIAAWLVPVFSLAGLQLRALMATDLTLVRRESHYLLIRLLGFPLAMMLLFVVVFCDALLGEYWVLVIAASVGRFADLGADFFYGIRQRYGQFWEIGRSQLARSIAGLAAFALAWALTSSLMLAMLVSGASAWIVTFRLDVYPNRSNILEFLARAAKFAQLRSFRKWRKVKLRMFRILGHALPLAVVALLNGAVIATPRVLLGWFGTVDQIAALTCLNSLLAAPALLATAYSAARAPDFALAGRVRSDCSFARLLGLALLSTFVVAWFAGIAFSLYGVSIIQMIYGDTFGIGRATVLPTAVFMVCWVSASVLGTAATAMRWTSIQLTAFFASFCAGTGAGYILVPKLGLDGACWSLAISGIILIATYVLGFAARIVWSADPARSVPSLLEPKPVESTRFRTTSLCRQEAGARKLMSGRRQGGGEPAAQKRRVLQVTSELEVGGVELWLSRVLRHPQLSSLHLEILSLGEKCGALRPRFEAAGIRVHHLAASPNPLSFLAQLCKALIVTGPWDVVHSHVNRRNSLVLFGAMLSGVRSRISHSHHVYASSSGSLCVMANLYARLSRELLARVATHRLACSSSAGVSLYGDSIPDARTFSIVPCGLDIDEIRSAYERGRTRGEFRIPDDALVVAHAGRFVPEKNHRLLLDVAQLCTRRDPIVHFLLLGDGPLRPEMEKHAEDLGIGERVTFAGNCDSIVAILSDCADVFFFPSISEGLGLALIEAHLAGLPCLYGDHLPKEVDLYPETSLKFSLGDHPEKIAELLLHHATLHRRGDLIQRLKDIEETTLSVKENARVLTQIYMQSGNTQEV